MIGREPRVLSRRYREQGLSKAAVGRCQRADGVALDRGASKKPARTCLRHAAARASQGIAT